jgi:aminopeptidase N
MKIKNVLLIVLALFIAACKTTQQTGTQTTASKTEEKKTPEPEIYRASNSRLSDIIHMELRVSFDWDKKYLFGQATLTVKPYFYSTDSLFLDARGMEIKELSLVSGENKSSLQFKNENDSLKIKLNKTYPRDEQYQLYIDYIAKPEELKEVGGSAAIASDKGLYFINADGKEKGKPKQLWTQGETQANSVWFPTIDSPNERMTQEIYITVDTSLVTLSNGALISSIVNTREGSRTDYWKQALPHAPYLAMMAISNFKIVKDKWRNMEVNYYVDAEYENYARQIFGNTPEMLEFFSTKLGVDYPWEKYAQVVAHDYVSGAMENTSATLHGEFIQRDDRALLDETNEEVISHELFHQWFGDLVTTESWSNISLNESFATYGEYLWNEFKYGKDDADFSLNRDLDAYKGQGTARAKHLVRYDYEAQEEVFDVVSYQKGGRVLHMLRKAVGDDAFFKSLQLYLNINKFKPVEVHNLRLAFEEITGRDLNWFFNQWFFDNGHPDLEIKYTYNDSAGMQDVMITQKQDFEKNALFKIPLAIDVYDNSGVTRHDVEINKVAETFSFETNGKPKLVNVDAEKMMVCAKTDNHTNDEWIYQYEHAPLFMDRYEAVQKLGKSYSAGSAPAKVITKALKDNAWAIRKYAIGRCGTIAKSADSSKLRTDLIDMAKNDSKAAVREAALSFLAKNYSGNDLLAVYEQSVNDRSYDVMEKALFNISAIDKEKGLTIVKKSESDGNKRIRNIVANVYSDFGSDENNSFMISAMEGASGGQKYQMTIDYGKFLTRCKPQTIETGLVYLQDIARNASPWYVKLSGIQAMSELSKTCETKAKDNASIDDAARYKELKIKIDDSIKVIKEAETNKQLKKIYGKDNETGGE